MDGYDYLQDAPFFKGIERKNYESILKSLNAEFKSYARGRTVFREGDIIKHFGILAKGTAHSIKTNPDGKQTIITLLKPGSYIGILLAGTKERPSPVSILANEDISILFIPIKSMLTCHDCPQYSLLLGNLIDGLAQKALMLHERNDCLIKSSIKEKVLSYLKKTAPVGQAFFIPFSREEMADYLNVDRSALSRELSRLKREGIIDFHKNCFKLIGDGQ